MVSLKYVLKLITLVDTINNKLKYLFLTAVLLPSMLQHARQSYCSGPHEMFLYLSVYFHCFYHIVVYNKERDE